MINGLNPYGQKKVNTPLICRSVFIFSKGVVFFTQEAKPNSRDNIIALGKNTGDTMWVWDEGRYFTNHRHIKGSTLYFSAGTSVFAVDCNTGKTLWQFTPPDNLAYTTLHVDENHIFVSYQDRKPNPIENETILYELEANGLAKKWLTVKATDRDGFTLNFDHITVLPNIDHGLLIFCESRSWNYGPINEGRAEYVTFNLTKHKVHKNWGNMFNDIDIGGKALLQNNTLYLSSGWNQAASINVKTGRINWHVHFPASKATAGLMPVHELNGSLFLSLGNFGRLRVLDASTGLTINELEDIGTEWYATAFVNYNEHVWFTTTKGLYALDVNGKLQASLLNSDFIGMHTGNFTNGFGIDQSTGLMYGVRGSSFVCFKWA